MRDRKLEKLYLCVDCDSGRSGCTPGDASTWRSPWHSIGGSSFFGGGTTIDGSMGEGPARTLWRACVRVCVEGGGVLVSRMGSLGTRDMALGGGYKAAIGKRRVNERLTCLRYGMPTLSTW